MTLARHDEEWFNETSTIMAEAVRDELSPETMREQVVSMAVSAASGDDDQTPPSRTALKALAERMASSRSP